MQAYERRFNVGFVFVCGIVYTVSTTVVLYIYIYIYNVASSQGYGFSSGHV